MYMLIIGIVYIREAKNISF